MAEYDDATAAAVAAAREAFPDPAPGRRVVFGFDGYLDRVREVVADRHGPDSYAPVERLADYSDRVARSVETGSSLSFEWLQRGTRTGGHTCHLARVYDDWGFDPVMVGTYGEPEREAFASEFADCERFSLGEPGVTDAVEFDDGKLMLTEVGDTASLDWDVVLDGVSREVLVDRLDGATLLGVGYWAETPDLPDVLDGLADCWTAVDDPPETVLVDPGDVRKLDRDRLRAGREVLGRLEDHARVAVSANRAETRHLAAAYGDGGDEAGDDSAGGDGDAVDESAGDGDALADARTVRHALDTSLVVCHGIDRSVAVGSDGAAVVAVPATDDPVLTTSSGDHFNAGLALGLCSGLDAGPAVAVGNAVAGRFVRTGATPSLADVRSFLDEYEDAF